MSEAKRRTSELPSALGAIEPLVEAAPRLLLCLDYDGTLTPIAARPEIAVLDVATRNLVHEIAGLCTTAIVSGRDRLDVTQRVQVPEAFYVGSHGFDVGGPEGRPLALQIGDPYLPSLDAAERLLRSGITAIPGAIVERKRFSIATHSRLVARESLSRVGELVDDVLEHFPDLRREPGKEIIEVQPNVAWDKGKSVLWLKDALGLDDALALHVGDDLTDETVFTVLADGGAGIFVGSEDRTTAARYRLRDPDEVAVLLRRLIPLLRARI
jgi:alpha,alpha-trehalase